LARSVPVDAPEHGGGDLEDRRAAVEQQVIARTELRQVREVISELSRDQQLVLASQVCVDMGVSEFCARYGWSVEKYRKVAQRARGKLRVLVDEYERGERCRRLEHDIIAMRTGVAEGQELARAKAHIANCRACARVAGEPDRGARSVAAVMPLPAAIAGSIWSKLGGILSASRRITAMVRHPLTETGYGGVGAAGGSMASIGALKVGIAVVCVAGAAGSYTVRGRSTSSPDRQTPRGFSATCGRKSPHLETRRRGVGGRIGTATEAGNGPCCTASNVFNHSFDARDASPHERARADAARVRRSARANRQLEGGE
jgi:hypothetical protein